MDKTSTKLTISVSGLVNDIMKCIPDGSKSAFIQQVLLQSFLGKNFESVLITNFGIKEGQKIKKLIDKMLSGINLDSIQNLNTVKTEGLDPLDAGETFFENSDIIDQQKEETSFFNQNNQDTNLPSGEKKEPEFGFFSVDKK